jgi:hypothetical protein
MVTWLHCCGPGARLKHHGREHAAQQRYYLMTARKEHRERERERENGSRPAWAKL